MRVYGDSVCANVVRSLAELYYLWHVLATLVCCSLQLLMVYYICLQKIVTSNLINGTSLPHKTGSR